MADRFADTDAARQLTPELMLEGVEELRDAAPKGSRSMIKSGSYLLPPSVALPVT